MIRHLIVSALFLLTFIPSFSQSPQETEQATAIGLYEKIMQTRNPNTVLDLLKNYPIQEVESDSLQSYFYYYKGSAYGQIGQMDSALHYVEKAREMVSFEKYPEIAIQILRAFGNIYWSKSFFNLSLDNYQKALTISEKINSAEFQVSLLGNIAGIYAKLDNYPLALEYAKKAEDISKASGIQRPRSHMKIGLYAIELGLYEDGISSLEETIRRIHIDGKDSIALGYCYNSIVDAQLAIGNREDARANMKVADDIFRNINFEDANHYVLWAKLEMASGNLDQARKYILKAIDIAKEGGDLTQIRKAKMLDKELSMKEGKLMQVIRIQDEILTISDSIKSKQTLDRVYELEARFELAKKDQEIAMTNLELERQARFQLFLKVLVAVILLFSFLAIALILRGSRLKRALLSQEIDTLRVQINSVFGGGAKSLNLSLDQINKGLYKPLSDREYEILQLAVSDRNNGEIAESLFVSVNTVKFHLRNVYEKLGVSNRKEALEFLISRS